MHEKVDDKHLVERGLTNHLGYNTLSYFAPEQSYASSGRLGEQVEPTNVHAAAPGVHDEVAVEVEPQVGATAVVQEVLVEPPGPTAQVDDARAVGAHRNGVRRLETIGARGALADLTGILEFSARAVAIEHLHTGL